MAQRTSTEIRMRVGEGLAGQSALSGETINVPDAYADCASTARSTCAPVRTLNVLVVPVWGSQGKPVAIIQVLNKRNGTFERRDQMLLEQIAETIAPVAGADHVGGMSGQPRRSPDGDRRSASADSGHSSR